MTEAAAETTAPVPDDDLDDAPQGFGEKLRRALAVPSRLLGALFLPDRWIPREVTVARFGPAILAVIICGLISAAAIGVRLDVSTDILSQAAAGPRMGDEGGGGGGGDQISAAKSDREIAEDITKTLAVGRVMRLLEAGLWVPLELLFLTFWLYVLLWYVGGAPTLPRAFAASAHAALPHAVKSLVIAGAALSQPSLTPSQADGLVGNPLAATYAGLGPAAASLLSGVDPFMLWSMVLLGLGMAPAAEITRKRAFVALLVAFALYLGLGLVMCGGSPPPQGTR